MIDIPSPPEHLYKIVSKEDWNTSLETKKLVLPPIDDTFIHLATEEQLPRIRTKFWANKEIAVLTVETSKIEGDLRFETNPGGTTKFYHLYDGTIPLDAIVEVQLSKG